jgi:hypothetical protein
VSWFVLYQPVYDSVSAITYFLLQAASPAASVDVATMAAAPTHPGELLSITARRSGREVRRIPANIDGDAGAKDAGISGGEAASAAVIAARSEYGLDAADKRALYAERRTGCMDPEAAGLWLPL